MKILRIYLLGLSAWILAFYFALKVGAVADAPIELITELRLPRVLLASLIGMGLSIAGAVLQVAFSNPLCEPYTLGISSGSALGAVVGITLGLEWMISGIAGSAFLGAIVFTGILFLVSKRTEKNQSILLLTGVMLSFVGTSLVALWLSLMDSNGISSALLWLFGDLSRARFKGTLVVMVGIISLSLWIWSHWRKLDALLMGEEGALALGVDVGHLRRRLVVLTSFLVGICVSAGGMIGFIGLIVPHFVRRLVGSLHFYFIPLCGIWGATLLTLADCVSRVAVRPYELPVGIITALVGAPAFLWILIKKPAFN